MAGEWNLNDLASLSGDMSLEELLKRFAPSDADMKSARGHALMTAGFGILANANKPWQQAVGAGGQQGLLSYNDEIKQMQGQGLRNMAGVSGALNLHGQLQGIKEGALASQIAIDAANRRKAAQTAQLPQQALPPMGPPDAGGAMSVPNAPMQPPMQAQGGAMPTAGGMPGPSPRQMQYDQYMQLSQDYADKGLTKQAEQIMTAAEKFRPKPNGKPEAMTLPNGTRVMVQPMDDGPPVVLPFNPDLEEQQWHNAGGRLVSTGKLTGKEGPSIPTTQSPDNLASKETQLQIARMVDARAREFNANAQANANRGEIKETPDGYVRIGKDNSVTPIVNESGPVRPPLSGTIQKDIAQNNTTISLVREAIKSVNDYPGAFGLQNITGDTAMQRLDPRGVPARAKVANLSSQKFHDRSGAAVTASESPRLRPFIPDPKDLSATVITKLQGFEREATLMNQELRGGKSIAEVSALPSSSSDVVDFSALPKGK